MSHWPHGQAAGDSRADRGQIIELGRRHLVTEGAAGLSLRAIARDLGMVSSAVYRYVASRDDLLTLLLVDAYSELADAVDRAVQRRAGRGATNCSQCACGPRVGGRSAGPLGAAVRQPGAGLPAPRERTVGPGTRVVGALFDAIGAGIAPVTFRRAKLCGPTVVVGLRRDTRRSSGSPAMTPRWPSAFCCGRDWSVRSAWRCSVSTGPTR